MRINQMKFKITPLLIFSIGISLYGLYELRFGNRGEEGWGTLAAMVMIGFGIIAFLLHLLFLIIFKAKLWTQLGIEIFLIACFFISFRL